MRQRRDRRVAAMARPRDVRYDPWDRGSPAHLRRASCPDGVARSQPYLVALRNGAWVDQLAHPAHDRVLRRPHAVRFPAAPLRTRSAATGVCRHELVRVRRAPPRSSALRSPLLTGAESCMAKIRVVREFLTFLKQEKKFWLAPIVVILVLFGLLLVFAQSSAVAPFIYTLF